MSIRQKITLLLALLALVMAFQSVERVVQLHQSAQSFRVLAQRIDRATSEVETLSTATRDIEALTRQIKLASSLDDLTLQHDAAMSRVADAQGAAAALDEPETVASPYSLQFEELGRLLDALVAARLDVIVTTASVEYWHQNLQVAAGRLRAEILPFQLGFLSGLDGGTDAATTERDLRLLLGLSRLMSRMGDLLAADSDVQARVVQDDVARLVSSAVTNLATSSHLQNKRALAGVLDQIRTVLDGLANDRPAMSEGLQAQSAAELRVLASLADIGVLVSGFVRAEEEEVRLVYTQAVEAAERELWSEIVINAGFGLGIVIAVWFVFARQISARLERLSKNVLRLAEGDLTPVEPPEGRDELSRMMAALGVFRQNAQELRRSNEELANFAYAASHDLRTPLRAIRDLVAWTIEDAGDALDPAVARNLLQIRGRADRLSHLLKDLLDYARAGHGEKRLVQVDVPEVLDDIIEILDPGATLDLRFQGHDVVVTDAVPLRTILLNLIANSVRHRDQDSVVVTVSVETTLHGWAISVQDNGPGIPLRYQKKVFELFQTLQSRDVVEGSGLGLAMVEKLAGHIEGSVQLFSNPEVTRGTTFILHIPMRDIPSPDSKTLQGVAV